MAPIGLPSNSIECKMSFERSSSWITFPAMPIADVTMPSTKSLCCREQTIENGFARLNGEILPFVVDRRHWVRNIHSAIQHVVPGALRDTGYLGDESRGDAQFHQAFAQQFDHCVEMRVVQAARNQMLVAASQIGSRVIVRTAERHGQKRLLSADLAIHIDSLEKGGDSAIG